jgi:hypothetical protein
MFEGAQRALGDARNLEKLWLHVHEKEGLTFLQRKYYGASKKRELRTGAIVRFLSI